MKKYICPCCGFGTLEDGPHKNEICPVCFWEDDLVQYKDVDFAGGANEISLKEARSNYYTFGACEARFKSRVRKPELEEICDEGD